MRRGFRKVGLKKRNNNIVRNHEAGEMGEGFKIIDEQFDPIFKSSHAWDVLSRQYFLHDYVRRIF